VEQCGSAILTVESAKVAVFDILALPAGRAVCVQNYALFANKTARENITQHSFTVKGRIKTKRCYAC